MEKIGAYYIDDKYCLHNVPGEDKPLSIFDTDIARLPFYGIYPATIEMLPKAYKQEYEKKLLDGDLLIQQNKFWVFWYNQNIDNMADIKEIVFDERVDAQTLLEIYISFNSQIIDNILETTKEKFDKFTKQEL